ncbi:Hpt domain-containing protein [Oxalobacteraceae bacterium]|nr:Hpt domain-containing protein [Oxalobacteraceae bacterium]
MATLVDPEYRARLQALNDRFAAGLPLTLDRIEAALLACLAQGGDKPADTELNLLHDLLHGVAGSAGTFGFAVLGRECRRLEQQLRSVLAGEAGWPAAADDITALLRWARIDTGAASYEPPAVAGPPSI